MDKERKVLKRKYWLIPLQEKQWPNERYLRIIDYLKSQVKLVFLVTLIPLLWLYPKKPCKNIGRFELLSIQMSIKNAYFNFYKSYFCIIFNLSK